MELKTLHEQLFNLHLVQALGPLRHQRKNREDCDLKFHRKITATGSMLETIPNWNTRPAAAQSPSDKPPHDTVLATLTPAPYFSPLSEPVAIVMNRSNTDLQAKSERLRRIQLALENSFSNGKSIAAASIDSRPGQVE